MRNKILVASVLIIFVIGFLFFTFGGRSASRYFGKGVRQVLEMDNMEKYIGISFDEREGSTVKDITFEATDGYIYTQEFKDVSPLEGVIRWVPYGEDDSIFRTRAISRWTGGAVNYELPEDCVTVDGVDVGYTSDNERVKNLTYFNSEGLILSKEYREGIIDRQLGGWLEIRSTVKKVEVPEK